MAYYMGRFQGELWRSEFIILMECHAWVDLACNSYAGQEFLGYDSIQLGPFQVTKRIHRPFGNEEATQYTSLQEPRIMATSRYTSYVTLSEAANFTRPITVEVQTCPGLLRVPPFTHWRLVQIRRAFTQAPIPQKIRLWKWTKHLSCRGNCRVWLTHSACFTIDKPRLTGPELQEPECL